MKPAMFRSVAEREAYDHGRTQEQLRIARKALETIRETATKPGLRSRLWTIDTQARIALELTKPNPDTNYGHGSRENRSL